MKSTPLYQLLLNPRYWLTWLFMAMLRLISYLPFHWIEIIGSGLGLLLYKLRPSRAVVATINLKIAYPDKSAAEIKHLCRESFKQLGIGALEVGLAWWQQKRLIQSAEIIGLEHLHAALEKGNGVILLTSHFTCLEVGGHILCDKIALEAVYKPAKNKLFDYFMLKNREAHLTRLISNNSPRKIISALKNNHVVWYAPDQNLSGKNMVFAPFFNELATAITAPGRLAKASNAALIPYYIKRLTNPETGKIQYQITIETSVDNFPSDNIENDAAKINKINEDLIRHNPEQYLWSHKRYKTRPPGQAKIY